MLVTIGEELFAERFGAPPAVVLALPGWMRTRNDFDRVLGGLDALSVDLPGFGGASPAAAASVTSASYADRLAPALASAVLAKRFVVVAHSFGGRVAAHLAARHPDRVAGLVISAAPLLPRDDRPPPNVSRLHRVARWANQHGIVSDDRLEARRRRHGSADYRNATGAMRSLLVNVVRESYDDELRAIAAARMPTELVWGSRDTDVPVRTAERLMTVLGDTTRLTVVEGVGHLVPLEAPDALRAAIDRLLAR